MFGSGKRGDADGVGRGLRAGCRGGQQQVLHAGGTAKPPAARPQFSIIYWLFPFPTADMTEHVISPGK